MKSHNYQILEKITIEEAILRLRNKKILSKRFSNVMKLGECCVNCQLKRDYVALGKDLGDNLHWDLYANDGTLMTIDHILPRSKGGKNNLKNMQLMCSPCNFAKGNTYENNIEEKNS